MSINPQSENTFNLAIVPPPLAEAIQEEFPDIELATRFEFCPKVVFEYGEHINYENRGAFVDPAFLDMFSFRLLDGNAKTALNDPQNIILTKSFSEKYFDQKRPLDEVVIIEGNPFSITGILEDVPSNSHMQFDFLLPVQVKTLFGADLYDWGNVNIFSYVQLAENINFVQIDQKIRNWETPRHNDKFYLQQLYNIHKESGIQADEVVVSDSKYMNIFIVLAIVILVIACINFVNLQSAQVLKRTKEVGIRKVSGATKVELIKQFMIESGIVLIISYLLSFLLAEILLPSFEQLFNYKISLLFYDPSFLAILIGLFLLIILMTSVVPSLQFASFNPVGLVHNLTSKGKKRSLSRTILVILQFSFSVFFIIGTLVINQQFLFMKKSSLNNQKEKIIYLPFKGDIGSKYETFKSNLLNHSTIEKITAKNSIPTQVANKTSELNWPGKNQDQDFVIEATGVDMDYFETLGIEILEGRNFSNSYASDNMVPVILNETAIKNTGLTDPIGILISLWGYPGEIIGIVKDVHLKSLRNEGEGQIFYPIPDYTDQEMSDFGVILIKIKEDIPTAMSVIEDQWTTLNSGIPFEYHFLDEAVDNLYWEEMRLSRLMNYASILSVIICCLGLLGLAIYNSNTKIKEIGIRKINGASILNIITLLNKEYVQWVFISFILAFPFAWITLNTWLQNFAYQINISWWLFVLSGTLTLAIALLTINWQIYKVARKNPVEVLRYE
jgi:putative ABC transport system permease protein